MTKFKSKVDECKRLQGPPSEIFDYCNNKKCPVCLGDLKVTDPKNYFKTVVDNKVLYVSSISCAKNLCEYYLDIEWSDPKNINVICTNISFLHDNKLYDISQGFNDFNDNKSTIIKISDASDDYLLNTSEEEVIIDSSYLDLDKFTIPSLVKKINSIFLLK